MSRARSDRDGRGPGRRHRGHALSLGLVLALSACPRFHEGPLPGEPADATFTELPDGTRVRFVDEGEGPPVVLVHGFASSLDTWRGVRPELRQHHRVLALDLKGFGWSERPPGDASDYSPLAQARLVFALMDQRGIERAAIVGHSWGSSVVLAMALEHPERVERIALYDAWVFEEQLPPTFVWARSAGLGEAIFSTFYRQRADDKLAGAFYDPEVIEQGWVDAVEDTLDRPGTIAAALAAVRGQRYAAYQERYRQVDAPVLLLWGREDTIAMLEDGERLASMLPNAELEVYPRCGHFPMHEARAASTRDLLAFLDAAEHRDAARRDADRRHTEPSLTEPSLTEPSLTEPSLTERIDAEPSSPRRPRSAEPRNAEPRSAAEPPRSTADSSPASETR